jgi:hypothetical protein
MIRLYTYLYACVLVNAERQWKGSRFVGLNALVIIALIFGLNMQTLLLAISSMLHWRFEDVFANKALVVPTFAVLLSFCWLAFVRSGKGRALAEQFKTKGDDSILRCQIVAYVAMLGSVALFFGTVVLVALSHPPKNGVPDAGNTSVSSRPAHGL